MNNIRVYAIDLNLIDNDSIVVNHLTNEQFTEIAEEHGLIWSLGGFEDAFNLSNVSDSYYIRIINNKTN